MSNTSTVEYYINLACKRAGEPLNGECRSELQSALDGMVEDAVARAIAQLAPPLK